jgi:hypothetical protein
MPHEDHPTDRPLVHFIPDIHKPHDPALCGIRWIQGSDDPKDVTCPECKRKLAEVKK